MHVRLTWLMALLPLLVAGGSVVFVDQEVNSIQVTTPLPVHIWSTCFVRDHERHDCCVVHLHVRSQSERGCQRCRYEGRTQCAGCCTGHVAAPSL